MRACLVALLLALALPATAQTFTGSLDRGDDTLGDGEFVDRYEVRARAGATIRAVLTSDDFDPYVIVIAPGGEQADNDDCTPGDTSRACADLAAGAAGLYRILVTSYQAGESGRYRLVVEGTEGADRRDDGERGLVRGSLSARPGRAGRETAAVPLRDGRAAGELRRGDDTIRTGEFADAYAVPVQAGQTLSVALTSDDFDTYVMVQMPGGEQEDNDDCTAGDLRRSCLDVRADRSGTARVVATSYAAGATGRYTLTATTDGARAVRGTSGGRVETGTLAAGDGTLSSGEYRDRYPFTGTGGPVVLDLRAEGFDPYLIVTLPDGSQLDNDDYEGALDRSLLVVDTRPGAAYTAVVTSYAAGETGRYTLDVGTGAAPAGPGGGVRRESGRLAAGDERLRSGEFVDTFTFEGVPGQRVALDLTSDDFDTYLVVDPPRGTPVEDDDGGGRTGHSRLEMDLTEPGTYTVHVTSYAEGETGAYALAMDLSERFGQPLADAGRAPLSPRPGARPEARPDDEAPVRPPARRSGLTLDETLRGELDAQDARLASGEYTEVHTFDGDAGEPVRIELASDAFDTYLLVTAPSGEQVDNDDHEGSQNRSVIEFVMPESGRYRVTATSYRAGETGPYTLRLSQADALAPEPPAFDRIVGVFAGISDYDRPGLPDLQWTAQDAVVVRDAMIAAGMRPEDGLLLTDADATVGAVEAAIDRLARTTDERTLFVFFYSGHGGQVATDAAQRADPDGKDETIELYDAAITDDALDRLLSRLPAARQLVVLDACFSGGFAKDIITAPGRMGLFSSEEDVVSAVAAKFEAGGYLSHFFADAVAQRQADADTNGAVTPLELSQYLHDRYTSDVRGTGRELIVARDTRPEHQHLVVDRGSLGLYDSLLLLP